MRITTMRDMITHTTATAMRAMTITAMKAMTTITARTHTGTLTQKAMPLRMR